MSIEATLLADTWGMHGNVGWGWMTLMMILMVLFWGAVIFGVVWLIRGGAQGGSTPREGPISRESPVEILERRFAEGALSSEDYWARRQVLVNGTAEPNGRTEEGLTVSRSGGASES